MKIHLSMQYECENEKFISKWYILFFGGEEKKTSQKNGVGFCLIARKSLDKHENIKTGHNIMKSRFRCMPCLQLKWKGWS